MRDPAGKLYSSAAMAVSGMHSTVTSAISIRIGILFFMIQSPYEMKLNWISYTIKIVIRFTNICIIRIAVPHAFPKPVE